MTYIEMVENFTDRIFREAGLFSPAKVVFAILAFSSNPAILD